MLDLRKKKILVTGGAGFIGSHVVDNLLHKRGVKPENIRIPRSKDLDLRVLVNARKAVKDIDVVFHLAGDIGGIGYSSQHPAQQYYNCSMLDLQILEAAKEEGIEKIVMVSSACAYGHDVPVPLQEEMLFQGLPPLSHDGYGMAKRMTTLAAWFYRREYGLDAIVVVPNNTYGPHDDFNLADGHVIPSLIRKCLTRKKIVVWGDGTPTRDFFYVEDTAEGIILAMEKLTTSDPVNIGSGQETSIADLVAYITRLTGFTGEITYDLNKPKGQIRRSVDITKARRYMDFEPKWHLEEGLKKTIAWYKKHLLNRGKMS